MISPDPIIYQVAETSLRASVVIATLLLLRPWLRRLIGSQWLCVLWLLILCRLLFPFSIQTSWSAVSLPWLEDPVSTHQIVRAESHVLEKGTHSVQVRLTERETESKTPPAGSVRDHANSATLVLAVLWVVGALVGLSGFTIRLIQTRRLAARTFPVTDPQLLVAFGAIDPTVRRQIGLRMSDAVNVPTLAGVFRPQIWIPVAWLEQLSPDEMHHVLLHELGHARRRDLFVQRLFLLAQYLHWFNPLIWVAGHFAKADREIACDAWVLARLGEEKSSEYGSTLLRIITLLRRPARISPILIEMATSKKELTTRVYAIDGFRRTAAWQGALAASTVFTGLALLTTSARTPSSEPNVSERSDNLPASSGILPPSTAPDATQATSSAADNSKRKDLRIELIVTRLEAPLPAWEILKDHEIGRAILSIDEALKTKDPSRKPSFGVVAVLNDAERIDSRRAFSKIPFLVGTRTRKVSTVPGRASTITFPPQGRGQSLSIKPQVGEDGNVINLELVLGGANSKLVTFVSIRSGYTLLLRTHEKEGGGGDADPDGETLGQLFSVRAEMLDKPAVQGPRIPVVEIGARFFEVPPAALDDAELKAWLPSASDVAKDVPPMILTEEKVQEFLEWVNRRKDIELLSSPRVTTRTKQRAVIEIIREVRVPATWKPDPEKPGSWSPATFETTNVGMTLEVEPEVKEGDSVALSVAPQFVEALGFVDLETGKPVQGHRPAPRASFADRLSNWKEFLSAQVPDGRRTNLIFSKRLVKKDVELKSEQSVLMVLKETADTKPFEAEAPKGRVVVIVTAKLLTP